MCPIGMGCAICSDLILVLYIMHSCIRRFDNHTFIWFRFALIALVFLVALFY